MADTSPLEVASNSDWLPHAFTPDGRRLTAVLVPPDLRAKLTFLTDSYFKGAVRKDSFETGALTAATASGARVPLNFIFNTSFCCSTLLARALEVPGCSASLKEPNILVNIAERLIGDDSGQVEGELELALRLLERPFGSASTIIAKPSNFANRLLEPILDRRAQSRAVLLYSDAGTFLRSIAKRGLSARINARRLYRNLAAWTSLDFGFSSDDLLEQTDLQIAALAWLMQIAHFQSVLARWGPKRVVLIEAADFLAEPARVLDRIQSLFGLGLEAEQIAGIVNGPIFRKHSKFSEVDYDVRRQDEDQKALAQVHSDELEMVIQWLDVVADHCGVRIRTLSADR